MTTNYFAYGIATSTSTRWSSALPTPDLSGPPCCSATPCPSTGWQPLSRGKGRRRSAGLWSVSERDLARLDRYEGEGTTYDRGLVTVLFNEREVEAWTYLLRDPELSSTYTPYFKAIRRGYEAFGLPTEALDRAVAALATASPTCTAHGGRSVFERSELRIGRNGIHRIRPDGTGPHAITRPPGGAEWL